MLLTMPLTTRCTGFALSTVVPVVHGYPLAPTEAVPVAIEIVGVAVSESSTKQFELQTFPVLFQLFRFGILGFEPLVFPVLEALGLLSDGRPRRVVI